jgi:hypothetical protein
VPVPGKSASDIAIPEKLACQQYGHFACEFHFFVNQKLAERTSKSKIFGSADMGKFEVVLLRGRF